MSITLFLYSTYMPHSHEDVCYHRHCRLLKTRCLCGYEAEEQTSLGCSLWEGKGITEFTARSAGYLSCRNLHPWFTVTILLPQMCGLIPENDLLSLFSVPNELPGTRLACPETILNLLRIYFLLKEDPGSEQWNRSEK